MGNICSSDTSYNNCSSTIDLTRTSNSVNDTFGIQCTSDNSSVIVNIRQEDRITFGCLVYPSLGLRWGRPLTV